MDIFRGCFYRCGRFTFTYIKYWRLDRMLMPERTKFRKQHRGRMRGKAYRGSMLAFGEYGIKALEPCWLTARQIEAARIIITQVTHRGGKFWIRVFPDKSVTKKPAETRKSTSYWHWISPSKNRKPETHSSRGLKAFSKRFTPTCAQSKSTTTSSSRWARSTASKP